MRGKIIQYNGADGSGTIVVEGRQHPFVLAAWRGDSAPGVNKTVEVTFDGDAISAITAVGEDVLLKEKAAELSGKLGASFNRLRASIPASAGAGSTAAATDAATPPGAAAPTPATNYGAPGNAITVNAILERYGKTILIAWAVFLVGSLAFNAISISMMGQGMGKSLFDVASAMGQFGAGGGGMVKVLLVLGYASIAVPLFWRDRRAWFVLVVPLVAVLWAIVSVMHALDSVPSGFGQSIADMFHVGFGFYLSLIAAIVLAAFGVKRGLRAT